MSYRLTQDALKEFGFKPYPLSPFDRNDANWQYGHRDDNGIRFYVNVRWWDNAETRARLASQGLIADGFDACCQFDSGSETFNVTKLSVAEMTPAAIVHWFNAIWSALRCDYYERTR